MVARRFDVSRRRDTLTFQHHAEVCALADDDQDFWLDIAAEHHWSKADLRRRVRAARRNGQQAHRSTRTPPRLPLHSDHARRWEQAARMSGTPLDRWMMERLDEAADAALDTST